MEPEIRAVIDIGTTSVKLLVAEVTGRKVEPLFSAAEVTRLGEGLERTRALSPIALVRTSQAVAAFKRKANQFMPRSIRVLATSAAREACNQKDLVEAIRQASGLLIEVVSDQQEADLIFRGATTDPELANGLLVVFDLGGGSTEIAVGEGMFAYWLRSLRLGTLRLLEVIQPGDPPHLDDRLRCIARVTELLAREVVPSVLPLLKEFCGRNVRLAGTGGTAAILAKLAAPTSKLGSTDGVTRVDTEQMRRTVDRLWSLPVAERLKIRSIPRERADLVLTGSVIIEQIMRQLGFAELMISRRGMRYGAVLEPPDSSRLLESTEDTSASELDWPKVEPLEAMQIAG